MHLRRTDFLDRWNQTVHRGGLTYFLADNVRLTAGYAYVNSYLAPSGIVRPEHSPWQQVWWASRSGRLSLLQWIRAEQRFNHRIKGDQLASGYMNLFQQQTTGNVFVNNHVARLFLFHTLDLRRQP